MSVNLLPRAWREQCRPRALWPQGPGPGPLASGAAGAAWASARRRQRGTTPLQPTQLSRARGGARVLCCFRLRAGAADAALPAPAAASRRRCAASGLGSGLRSGQPTQPCLTPRRRRAGAAQPGGRAAAAGGQPAAAGVGRLGAAGGRARRRRGGRRRAAAQPGHARQPLRAPRGLRRLGLHAGARAAPSRLSPPRPAGGQGRRARRALSQRLRRSGVATEARLRARHACLRRRLCPRPCNEVTTLPGPAQSARAAHGASCSGRAGRGCAGGRRRPRRAR
jgi:hypothetical protein